MRLLTIAFLGLSTAAGVHAQADSPIPGTTDSLSARILAASALPALAGEIRGAGVTQRDLAGVLALLGERRIPATDARRILDEEWRAAREHGPVPGLAGFVRGRLDEGLRGEALAAAIRGEHARRGTGGDAPGARRDERAARNRREPATAPKRPAANRQARPDARAKAAEHR